MLVLGQSTGKHTLLANFAAGKSITQRRGFRIIQAKARTVGLTVNQPCRLPKSERQIVFFQKSVSHGFTNYRPTS